MAYIGPCDTVVVDHICDLAAKATEAVWEFLRETDADDVRAVPDARYVVGTSSNVRIVVTARAETLTHIRTTVEVEVALPAAWTRINALVLRLDRDENGGFRPDPSDVRSLLWESARILSDKANALRWVRIEPPSETALKRAWEQLKSGESMAVAERHVGGTWPLRWTFYAVEDVACGDEVVVRGGVACGAHTIVPACEQTEYAIDLTDADEGVSDLARCATTVAHMATDALRGLQRAELT